LTFLIPRRGKLVLSWMVGLFALFIPACWATPVIGVWVVDPSVPLLPKPFRMKSLAHTLRSKLD